MSDENQVDEINSDIEKRLLSLGYTVVPEDGWMLGFCVQKVEIRIKLSCHIESVPDELRLAEIDMICGEFLLAKKQSGKLEGYDFEAAVKSVSEGDVSVNYSSDATKEQQFDALIERLANPDVAIFTAYRRIKW